MIQIRCRCCIPNVLQIPVADVVSDVDTFMQNVGAAWLMLSLNGSPFLVAGRPTSLTLSGPNRPRIVESLTVPLGFLR
jgi:hypothetical protein